MGESGTSASKLKELQDRFAKLRVNIHNLLCEFIYWNDVMRYPDLPEDSERPGRLASVQRNIHNENQVRYLSIAKEDSIILNVWALLYDRGEYSEPTLSRLGLDLSDPRYFPDRQGSQSLPSCIRYLSGDSFTKRFTLHRNEFIAHISSSQASSHNIVDDKDIYRVVPKTIYLAELLNGDLANYSLYFDNQFKGIARDVARFFSHSEPDALLAELFAKRALPTDEFEAAVTAFLDAYVAREKAERAH